MNYSTLFGPGTAYKESFAVEVTKLFATIATVEQRIDTVQSLTDAYVAQTGERPESPQLDRLATWILKGYEEERKAPK